MSDILWTRQLGKDYGDGFGLSPLDLRVGEGELVMLVGHNGSGKSTLLGLCAGLVEPTNGEARIAGSPVDSVRARAARSFVPDRPVLYDDLNLWEHIAYNAALHAASGWEERAVSLVQGFRLGDRLEGMPARFSRGMRQKAALVMALSRPFELLLADEPFLGLDGPSQEYLVGRLAEAAAGGAAVVVSTHQANLVSVATRCVGLADGSLAYDGRPDLNVVNRVVYG